MASGFIIRTIFHYAPIEHLIINFFIAIRFLWRLLFIVQSIVLFFAHCSLIMTNYFWKEIKICLIIYHLIIFRFNHWNDVGILDWNINWWTVNTVSSSFYAWSVILETYFVFAHKSLFFKLLRIRDAMLTCLWDHGLGFWHRLSELQMLFNNRIIFNLSIWAIKMCSVYFALIFLPQSIITFINNMNIDFFVRGYFLQSFQRRWNQFIIFLHNLLFFFLIRSFPFATRCSWFQKTWLIFIRPK